MTTTDLVQQKRQAHAMLDLLAPEKINTVVGMLGGMLDPVALAAVHAPVEDSPITLEEHQALAESREWLKHNKPIAHEVVLAELGITQEEIENYRDPA